MAFTNNRWVLAGLTSYGDGCANVDRVGIYTRVSAFIPFIYSNTGVPTSTRTTSLTSTSTKQPNSTRSQLGENHGNTVHLHIFIFILCIFLLV